MTLAETRLACGTPLAYIEPRGALYLVSSNGIRKIDNWDIHCVGEASTAGPKWNVMENVGTAYHVLPHSKLYHNILHAIEAFNKQEAGHP